MNDCIFCKIINGEIPSKKLYEDDKVLVIMDANPAVDGHALVIPKKHITDIMEMDDETLVHIYGVAKKLAPGIMKKLGSKGLTMGVNYGDSQAVKHFHLHILPDYFINMGAKRDKDEIFSLLSK